MKFNDFFNLKRFLLLLKQDLLINRTKYGLTIVGLGLIGYLVFYWFLNSNKDNMIRYEYTVSQNYFICFMFFSLVVGVVIGTAFPDLSNKVKTSHYLLSPGSTLEKMMVQFMLRIGLFVPLALALFWIAIRLAKASLIPGESGLDPSLIPYFEFRGLISNGHRLWDMWEILFFVFGLFSYGVCLFAGTTYFKRYALVKTVIFSAVLLGVIILFFLFLCNFFYPNTSIAFDMDLKDYPVTEHFSGIQLFLLILSLVSWMFFLFIGYFKLKEMEA